MTAVHVQPLSGSTPLSAADFVPAASYACVIGSRDDGTNTVTSPLSVGRPAGTPSPIDRTIEFALTRYEDLLHRLAD